MKTFANIRIGTADGAGWLLFDRPEKHNAMSRAMWEAVPEAIAALERTPGLRAVVLRGAGTRAFVAGADIGEFETMRAGEDAVVAYNDASRRAFEAIAGCSLPTIASIRGYCIGGGLAIAACCDLRYAADDAVFAIPAVRLGLGYPVDSLRRIVDLTGPAHAREIFLTGRHYRAAEAARMGLVNRTVPPDELDACLGAVTAEIAAAAPLTVAATRVGIAQLLRGAAGDLAAAEAAVDRCFASRDYAEGRRAFLEGRRPEFRGD